MTLSDLGHQGTTIFDPPIRLKPGPLEELDKAELVDLVRQAVAENEKLLRACHRQRDRARDFREKWLQAEKLINRIHSTVEQANEERNKAIYRLKWEKLTGYLSASRNWIIGSFNAAPPDWDGMKWSLNNKGLLPPGWIVTEVSAGCIKLERKE